MRREKIVSKLNSQFDLIICTPQLARPHLQFIKPILWFDVRFFEHSSGMSSVVGDGGVRCSHPRCTNVNIATCTEWCTEALKKMSTAEAAASGIRVLCDVCTAAFVAYRAKSQATASQATASQATPSPGISGAARALQFTGTAPNSAAANGNPTLLTGASSLGAHDANARKPASTMKPTVSAFESDENESIDDSQRRLAPAAAAAQGTAKSSSAAIGAGGDSGIVAAKKGAATAAVATHSVESVSSGSSEIISIAVDDEDGDEDDDADEGDDAGDGDGPPVASSSSGAAATSSSSNGAAVMLVDDSTSASGQSGRKRGRPPTKAAAVAPAALPPLHPKPAASSSSAVSAAFKPLKSKPATPSPAAAVASNVTTSAEAAAEAAAPQPLKSSPAAAPKSRGGGARAASPEWTLYNKNAPGVLYVFQPTMLSVCVLAPRHTP